MYMYLQEFTEYIDSYVQSVWLSWEDVAVKDSSDVLYVHVLEVCQLMYYDVIKTLNNVVRIFSVFPTQSCRFLFFIFSLTFFRIRFIEPFRFISITINFTDWITCQVLWNQMRYKGHHRAKYIVCQLLNLVYFAWTSPFLFQQLVDFTISWVNCRNYGHVLMFDLQ